MEEWGLSCYGGGFQWQGSYFPFISDFMKHDPSFCDEFWKIFLGIKALSLPSQKPGFKPDRKEHVKKPSRYFLCWS